MARPARWILLASMVLLAGCAQTQESGSTPTRLPSTEVDTSTTPIPLPSTIEQADLFSLQPELIGCRAWETNFDPFASDVEKLLPPGYQATGTAYPVLAAAHFDAVSCDAITLNNETLLVNVTLLAAIARVAVDGGLAEGADFQLYDLELLATDQTLVNLLMAIGFDARLASIELNTESAPYQMRVSVEGALWYELSAFPGSVYDAPEDSYVLRHHQVGPEGAVWYDYDLTKTMTAFSGTTTMRIHAGILQELDLADQGVQRAETWVGVSGGLLNFGKP